MKFFAIISAALMLSCTAAKENKLEVIHGEQSSKIAITGETKYLLLPIEAGAENAQVEYLTPDGQVIDLNIRLAVDSVSYTMPLELRGQDTIVVRNLAQGAVAWELLALSDTYTEPAEKFRPEYHYAPQHGWMNDPNGMVYKDGEYHLFYQHNPYGSTWGNMHWGHAVSRDLVEWEELPIAIYPDRNGAAYSGSCIVDTDNVSGFGEGAILAFYTSHGKRETQSIAYSTDGGRSFTKYEGNPVVSSETEWDFRDPKVLRYEPTGEYVMVLAAGQKVEFHTSKNLRDWSYAGKFGEEYGHHEGGVWECPDLMEMEMAGGEKRWVLIVNVNPGAAVGGSATQYFIGDFDGKTFSCEDEKNEVKWLDYGSDHYAAVTWSNVPDGRHLAIAWMSNWQYANSVPTEIFRSANTVVRSLSLFSEGGETYVASTPVDELKTRRVKVDKPSQCSEVCFSLTPLDGATSTTFTLSNSKGEKVDFIVDFTQKTLTVDRHESGDISFSGNFAKATVAPLYGDGYDFRIYIDVASIECFVNGGKTTQTNIVFPSEPYSELTFGNECSITNLEIFDI